MEWNQQQFQRNPSQQGNPSAQRQLSNPPIPNNQSNAFPNSPTRHFNPQFQQNLPSMHHQPMAANTPQHFNFYNQPMTSFPQMSPMHMHNPSPMNAMFQQQQMATPNNQFLLQQQQFQQQPDYFRQAQMQQMQMQPPRNEMLPQTAPQNVPADNPPPENVDEKEKEQDTDETHSVVDFENKLLLAKIPDLWNLTRRDLEDPDEVTRKRDALCDFLSNHASELDAHSEQILRHGIVRDVAAEGLWKPPIYRGPLGHLERLAIRLIWDYKYIYKAEMDAVLAKQNNDANDKDDVKPRLTLEDMFRDDGMPNLRPLPYNQRHIRPNRGLSFAIQELAKYQLIRRNAAKDDISSRGVVINVSVSSVEFLDHPGFTVEDFLAKQILKDFQEYRRKRELQLTKFFEAKIQTIKTKIAKLHQKYNKSKDGNLENELIRTLEQVLAFRFERDSEEQKERVLFRRMYSCWRNIEAWRFDNKSKMIGRRDATYRGSGIKLVLEKMEGQRETIVGRTQSVNEEMAEVRLLNKLRNSSNMRLNAKFGQVQKLNETTAQAEIETRIQQCRYAIDEPYYVVHVSKNSPVHASNLCIPQEQRRRQMAMAPVNVRVKSCDQTIESRECPIEFPRFGGDVNLKYKLHFYDVPSDVSFEIRRNNALASRLASCTLPTAILEKQRTFSGPLEFEGTPITAIEQLSPSDFVTYIKPIYPDYNSRRIQGTLNVTIEWESTGLAQLTSVVTDNSLQQEASRLSQLVKTHEQVTVEYSQFGEPNIVPYDSSNPRPMLPQIYMSPDGALESLNLDTRDPRNKKIAHLIQLCKASTSTDKQFRVTTLPSELCIGASKMDRDRVMSFRQRILRLRKEGAISAEDRVPLVDRDIPEPLYRIMHDQKNPEVAARTKMITDAQRSRRIHVSEVVREDEPLTWSLNMDWLLRPRRKLRPTRIRNRPVANQTSCHLLFQILHSQNLPVRNPNGYGQNMGQFGVVQPFIEISFMNQTIRSGTGFGPNPRWNETLTVPVNTPNASFTPTALQSIKDDIEINIYDELVVQNGADYRAQNTYTSRTEKRWLGRMTIPFTTVYFNERIEGHFPLEIPLIHLGYTNNVMEPAMLWFFATLDPPIALPNIASNNDDWISHDEFLKGCNDWANRIKSLPQVPSHRSIEPFVANTMNEPVLVTRYVRPLAPWLQTTPELFIRFVACIPFVEDVHTVPGMRDIWMTSSEFLSVGSGDWEEHAILLANYFLWTERQNQMAGGWETYLAVGTAVPEGQSTYVIRRNVITNAAGVHIQGVLVFNAATGQSFPVPELGSVRLCPLKDIGIVFNDKQIWGNIQGDLRPSDHRFSFQFEDQFAWRPLLNADDPSHFDAPLQEAHLSYYQMPASYFDTRQEKLEWIIESRFMTWRKLPTKWNYAVSKTLRETLVTLEPLCQTGGRIAIAPQDQQIHALSEIYPGLYGFPLHLVDGGMDELLQETDENPAVSLVFNTKVHENEDPDAEFARAVHFYSYTNKIASVWIYVAAVSKRQSLR